MMALLKIVLFRHVRRALSVVVLALALFLILTGADAGYRPVVIPFLWSGDVAMFLLILGAFGTFGETVAAALHGVRRPPGGGPPA